MKLEKAIEILNQVKNDTCTNLVDDDLDAVQLGIEALKAWKEIRRDPDVTCAPILPGETEED